MCVLAQLADFGYIVTLMIAVLQNPILLKEECTDLQHRLMATKSDLSAQLAQCEEVSLLYWDTKHTCALVP